MRKKVKEKYQIIERGQGTIYLGLTMYTISGLFPVSIGDHEFLQYARVVDMETGDERLLEAHELKESDPDAYSVGEGEAYKVSLAANTVEKTYGTYQFTPQED